jgi:hypothetical protein
MQRAGTTIGPLRKMFASSLFKAPVSLQQALFYEIKWQCNKIPYK